MPLGRLLGVIITMTGIGLYTYLIATQQGASAPQSSSLRRAGGTACLQEGKGGDSHSATGAGDSALNMTSLAAPVGDGSWAQELMDRSSSGRGGGGGGGGHAQASGRDATRGSHY